VRWSICNNCGRKTYVSPMIAMRHVVQEVPEHVFILPVARTRGGYLTAPAFSARKNVTKYSARPLIRKISSPETDELTRAYLFGEILFDLPVTA